MGLQYTGLLKPLLFGLSVVFSSVFLPTETLPSRNSLGLFCGDRPRPIDLHFFSTSGAFRRKGLFSLNFGDGLVFWVQSALLSYCFSGSIQK